ncbi:MAG: hypothetical protein ABSC77_14350 [Terracidiphilus sp.]|jgi:hypothetical protein
MSDRKESRTEWAERQVEEWMNLPFIAEAVFRSPKKLDPTEKEVCDHLLFHKGEAVVISQKMQEDPDSRTEDKNVLWVRKKVKDATAQLLGALRTGNTKPIWCEHSRRGRVDFANGLPPVRHGIVLVETWSPVDLQTEVESLPLTYDGVPISYFSTNDFVNLALQLRTIPELYAYLDARRTLPMPSLRLIGDERCLFEMYLLDNGSLAGYVGHADAKIVCASRNEEIEKVLRVKASHDQPAAYLEYVTDALATRHPDALSGLSPQFLAAFDPNESRASYLEMQEVLMDLRLRERAELGRALISIEEQMAGESERMKFRAMHIDNREEIWILAASRGIERQTLLERMVRLTRGAMAFYQKPRAMYIADRDGVSYEVGLTIPGYEPSEIDAQLGREFFGHLRMTITEIGIV